MEMDGTAFASPLPLYIPPRKPDEKLVTESKDAKYGTFTPLLSESVRFIGGNLGNILQLKFMDNYFNDRKNYLLFSLVK